MQVKRVFVVGSAVNYPNWISNYKLVNDVEDADIVFFTGGEDVDPSLYGAEKHSTTYSSISRDERELKIFSNLSVKQLVIGVCRGAQFLTMANGGKLVQNVHNHGIYGTHKIRLVGNTKIELPNELKITSTHHQMMYPYDLADKDYTLLYTSFENRSDVYEGDLIDPTKLRNIGEPEIVIYHRRDLPVCLAIQGHPEMMSHSDKTIEVLNTIVDNLLNNE